MTSLIESQSINECGECNYYSTCCNNSESDHFGHTLAELHPACNEFAGVAELELCNKCGEEYVADDEDLCLNCK